MGPKLKTTSSLAEKMKPLTAINSEGHRISNKICPGISNTQELNLYFLNFKVFFKYFLSGYSQSMQPVDFV